MLSGRLVHERLESVESLRPHCMGGHPLLLAGGDRAES